MKPTYEELEARCAALAAELSAVDKIHNAAVFITDDHYEQCPPEVQKIIRSLAVLQIPAHEAFLVEVRAQGADAVAAYHAEREEALRKIAPFASRDHKNARIHAMNIAAQLRQEAK